MDSSSTFFKVGDIAQRASVPIFRVQYFIRTRNIKPAYHSGHIRLFTMEQVEKICQGIAKTDALRDETARKS